MAFKRRPPAGSVRRVRAIDRNLRGVMVTKAGVSVQFESFQERALLLRLDRDPTVVEYKTQPERITFRDGQGHLRQYTYDVWVRRRQADASEQVEWHEVTLAARVRQRRRVKRLHTRRRRRPALPSMCTQRMTSLVRSRSPIC